MKKEYPNSDFQTPENVCRYMASLMPDLNNNSLILEPTKGKGNLVQAIKSEILCRGLKCKVVSPDDFYKWFKTNKGKKFDCILLNPPFTPMKKGYDILYDCMTLSRNIIALMPYLTIINSEARTNDIMNWGLKSVTHLPRSIFKGSRVQTCVLEMYRGYRFNTIFKTLPYFYQKPIK